MAVRSCLPSILQSTAGGLAIELMHAVFMLKDNAYWLLKGEVGVVCACGQVGRRTVLLVVCARLQGVEKRALA